VKRWQSAGQGPSKAPWLTVAQAVTRDEWDDKKDDE
jgi:hypothetical protein